jgi:cytochrome c oxidase subunit 4
LKNPGKLISVRVYAAVFVALLALTATTTAVAFVDLGAPWNAAIAVGIAIIKALLVILFFMHVFYSRPMTWIFVGAGFFWLVILFALTLADYVTRDEIGAGPLVGASMSQGEQGKALEIVPRVSR